MTTTTIKTDLLDLETRTYACAPSWYVWSIKVETRRGYVNFGYHRALFVSMSDTCVPLARFVMN
jgi:hypothetical protein